MSDSAPGRAARLSAVSAMLAVAGLAPGCGRKTDEPILRYEVRLEADARSADACDEKGSISFQPVNVAPQVADNMYQMTAFSTLAEMTDKPVQDGPKNFECWYIYRSPALSPGQWQVTGEFSDGSKSCLRDVEPGLPNRIRIDQEDGCVEFDTADIAHGAAASGT